jgi:surfeit locus 1 family protein
MIIAGRKFRPALWSILLTLGGVGLFVVLAMWQLDRAEYKSAIVEKHKQQLAQPAQNFDARDDLADVEFRRLIVRGEYDLEHSFYVDNKLHRGVAGYLVLTPFKLEGSEQIILIDRGWVAIGESRQTLPGLRPAKIESPVVGVASFPDGSGFRMGDLSLSGQWPLVIPYIDIEALQAQFSPQLLPLVLRLAPDQPGHYIRAWKPVWADPEKSRAYAVQWFAFALIALTLFLVLNLRKVE